VVKGDWPFAQSHGKRSRENRCRVVAEARVSRQDSDPLPIKFKLRKKLPPEHDEISEKRASSAEMATLFSVARTSLACRVPVRSLLRSFSHAGAFSRTQLVALEDAFRRDVEAHLPLNGKGVVFA
jgi:hypothetical protein